MEGETLASKFEEDQGVSYEYIYFFNLLYYEFTIPLSKVLHAPTQLGRDTMPRISLLGMNRNRNRNSD